MLVALGLVALMADQGQSQTTGTVQIVHGGIGNGRVTSEPVGIDCTIGPGGFTGTCVASYPEGTRVKLRATPADDSSFLGWAPLIISGCRNGDPVAKKIGGSNLDGLLPKSCGLSLGRPYIGGKPRRPPP
jgi:hypothetical protein